MLKLQQSLSLWGALGVVLDAFRCSWSGFRVGLGGSWAARGAVLSALGVVLGHLLKPGALCRRFPYTLNKIYLRFVQHPRGIWIAFSYTPGFLSRHAYI